MTHLAALASSDLATPEQVVQLAPKPRRAARINAETFWTASLLAMQAHRAAGHADLTAPHAETPKAYRTITFINQHGSTAKVKQPHTFRCPPAQYWPDGVLPAGVVAPAVDTRTDAERLIARAKAEQANADRWAQHLAQVEMQAETAPDAGQRYGFEQRALQIGIIGEAVREGATRSCLAAGIVTDDSGEPADQLSLFAPAAECQDAEPTEAEVSATEQTQDALHEADQADATEYVWLRADSTRARAKLPTSAVCQHRSGARGGHYVYRVPMCDFDEAILGGGYNGKISRARPDKGYAAQRRADSARMTTDLDETTAVEEAAVERAEVACAEPMADAPEPAPNVAAPATFSHAELSGFPCGGYHAINTAGHAMKRPGEGDGFMAPRFRTWEAAEAFGLKMDRRAARDARRLATQPTTQQETQPPCATLETPTSTPSLPPSAGPEPEWPDASALTAAPSMSGAPAADTTPGSRHGCATTSPTSARTRCRRTGSSDCQAPEGARGTTPRRHDFSFAALTIAACNAGIAPVYMAYRQRSGSRQTGDTIMTNATIPTLTPAGYVVCDNELIHGTGATATEAWADAQTTLASASIALLGDDDDSGEQIGSWMRESDLTIRSATARLIQDVQGMGGAIAFRNLGGVLGTYAEVEGDGA